MLFEQGLDPHLKTEDGDTTLHRACEITDISLVQSCIAFGANVNQRNNSGETPLLSLVSKICYREQAKKLNPKSIELVVLLLKNNADVNAQDKNHLTALNIINYRKPRDEDLKKFLIQHGAKTSLQLLYKNHQWKIAYITTSFILFLAYYFYYS